jgi:hypothetical protein
MNLSERCIHDLSCRPREPAPPGPPGNERLLLRQPPRPDQLAPPPLCLTLQTLPPPPSRDGLSPLLRWLLPTIRWALCRVAGGSPELCLAVVCAKPMVQCPRYPLVAPPTPTALSPSAQPNSKSDHENNDYPACIRHAPRTLDGQLDSPANDGPTHGPDSSP